MIKVGITGSFASGKSALLNYLSDKGYACFNCDNAVHALYQKHDIQSKVLELFQEIGSFDKGQIASLVYSDDIKRKKLEDLLHPLVMDKMQEFLDINKSKNKIVFLEIPLLFEVGWEKHFDFIISLYCSKSVRQERALARGIGVEMFNAIDKSQLPEERKKHLANFTIDTDCDFVKVIAECEKIIESINR